MQPRDPRIEAFERDWPTFTNPEDRDLYKSTFAEGLLQQETAPIALGILRELSNFAGEDLTQYAGRTPSIAPLTPERSRQITDNAISKSAPWYRRGLANRSRGLLELRRAEPLLCF